MRWAGSALSGPLLQVGTLVSILGYMFWVEPLVAAIALALYSPQFLIVPLSQIRLNRLAREKALTVREMSAFIVDNAEDALLGAFRGLTLQDLVRQGDDETVGAPVLVPEGAPGA